MAGDATVPDRSATDPTAGPRVRFLRAATALATGELAGDELLEALARLVVPDFADGCWIDISGPRRRTIVVHAGGDEQAIARALARRPLRIDQLPQVRWQPGKVLAGLTEEGEQRELLLSLGLRSLVALPLRRGGEVIGALMVSTAGSGRSLGEAEHELAEALAGFVVLAYETSIQRAQAQRAMRYRRELLSVVSHDVRNPLGVIVMQAMLLEEKRRAGLLETSDLGPAIDRIQRSGKQIARLVDDLLDLGRLDSGALVLSLADHPLGAMLDEAIELARPAAERDGVELKARLEIDGSATLRCDRERLVQALGHLLAAALQLAAGGGQVLLRASASADRLRLSIEDDGPGVDPELLETIFRRPALEKPRLALSGDTPHTAPGGLGLGLPIARGIAEAHGGALWAESNGPRGSRFILELPAG